MNEKPTPPDFLVHDPEDTVGVVVVETVEADQSLSGWQMTDDSTIGIMSKAVIPLGHKIALVDIKQGDDIIKYGHDIGRAISPINKGDHVHTHNVKTKRW